MPEPSEHEPVEQMRAEAKRIHESAVYCSQGQLEAAKRWRAWHWSGGILAAGLGTLGAVRTFADCSAVLAGSLTVIGAIVAATMTGVRPDKFAERAQTSGNDYVSLRNDARRFVNIDLPTSAVADSRDLLEELANRASQLDHAADPIPKRAYERARKNISSGGQDFEVDQE